MWYYNAKCYTNSPLNYNNNAEIVWGQCPLVHFSPSIFPPLTHTLRIDPYQPCVNLFRGVTYRTVHSQGRPPPSSPQSVTTTVFERRRRRLLLFANSARRVLLLCRPPVHAKVDDPPRAPAYSCVSSDRTPRINSARRRWEAEKKHAKLQRWITGELLWPNSFFYVGNIVAIRLNSSTYLFQLKIQ